MKKEALRRQKQEEECKVCRDVLETWEGKNVECACKFAERTGRRKRADIMPTGSHNLPNVLKGDDDRSENVLEARVK